ncbi:MFS transporter [Novosphingobium sp.]|uniref:MFS transporter n=1 Tax=Novosphingobium sp. TaxID=1874826 RepID=UPI00286EAEA4|nr:MFS transporter [Novosphingobium sp.]
MTPLGAPGTLDERPQPTPGLGLGVQLLYGLGALASAAKTVPISLFLMLYWNQIVGLSAFMVSAIVMVSLVFDAVFDPLVGAWSDRLRSRLGRRLPLMYAAIVPMSVLFIMLWTPPRFTPFGIEIYLAVILLALRLFDTLFELPHLALVPELTRDYDERTRLLTIRSLFEAIGGIGISALAYNYFLREHPDGSGGVLSGDGYPSFGLFTGAVIVICLLISTVGLHRRISGLKTITPQPKPASLFGHMRRSFGSPGFKRLALAAMLIALGSGMGSALGLYWLLYFYRFTQAEISLLFVPAMIGLAATALTPVIVRRIGKRRAAVAMLWFYLAITSLPLLARLTEMVPERGTLLFLLVGLQSAVGAGTMAMVLIALSSMNADLVEEAELRTGYRSEGLMVSANTFVRKASQGLGTLAAGLVLTFAEFPTGADRSEVPGDVLTRMGWLYLAVTFGLALGSTLILRGGSFERVDHLRRLERLN